MLTGNSHRVAHGKPGLNPNLASTFKVGVPDTKQNSRAKPSRPLSELGFELVGWSVAKCSTNPLRVIGPFAEPRQLFKASWWIKTSRRTWLSSWSITGAVACTGSLVYRQALPLL